MAVATVRVPFQEDTLQQIDQFVEKEARSRADFILEATRIYIERKLNWQQIFSYGEQLAVENDFSETDIMSEIKAYRSGR